MQQAYPIVLRQFWLSLLEEVWHDICNVIAMITNFSIFSCLNSNERRPIYFRNTSEDLCLAWTWAPINKDVAGAHRLPNFSINLLHAIFISDCLRNNPFCLCLANNVFVQLLYKLWWSPLALYILLDFWKNFFSFILVKLWQVEEVSEVHVIVSAQIYSIFVLTTFVLAFVIFVVVFKIRF